MEIIPVIDICRGRVVHALRGQRATYQPIQSGLCTGSDPFAIVQAFMDLYPFKKIYIADIDAIGGLQINSMLADSLCEQFPEVCFWIDEGNSVKEEIIAVHDSRKKQIIGSETGISPEILSDIKSVSPPPILSLDFMDRNFMGNMALFLDPSCWTDDVIIMNLARVGASEGPDFELFSQISTMANNKNFYMAGGIRDKEDIQSLEEAGISGVLTATALHNGVITAQDLRELTS